MILSFRISFKNNLKRLVPQQILFLFMSQFSWELNGPSYHLSCTNHFIHNVYTGGVEKPAK